MRILIVGIARRNKGGVATVLKRWQETAVWKRYHCRWLETQIAASYVVKLAYLLRAYFLALFIVPFFAIVHFHTTPGNSMLVQYPIMLWAWLWHKKVVIQLHVGNQIDDHRDDRFFHFVLCHSDVIVVLAHSLRNKLLKFFPDLKRVEVIYNPAPPIVRNGQKQKQILYTAYMVENKGYATLIKAYAKVADEFPEWSLVMAGAGETDKARKLVEECGMKEKIAVLDWVEGEEKERLFRDSSVYCMASEKEGFPLSVLEAWANGLALVTTLAGVLAEVVTTDNALVFDFGNERQLASCLQKVMSDDKLLQELSDESYRLAARFDMAEIECSIDKLYQSLS